MKNNLKLSYITHRPKHYKQDPIKQDEFKEEINENIKKNDYDLVLFMDESRFELIQIPVMDGFLVKKELQLKYLLDMRTSIFIQLSVVLMDTTLI